MVLGHNDADRCNEDINLCKKSKFEEQVDRLSNLPDCIIHHIFSFLSTLDVVGTSVLAKRWRYLWTMTPILDFDDSLFVDRKYDFATFVNFVHASYKATTINGYRLSVQQTDNVKHLQTWISFAVMMKTEELSVDSCSSFVMPCSESLKELRVSLRGGTLKMPTVGCFSFLETLSLSDVSYMGLESSYLSDVSYDFALVPKLSMISFKFSSLKRLSLKECSLTSCVEVRCPLLEEMEIEKCYDLERLTICAEKLHLLSVHDSFTFSTAWVKIIAPRLQTFKWLDYVVGTFSIEKFTCLRDADVSLVPHYDPRNKEIYFQKARSFLNRISSAGTLCLELAYFWGLSIQNSLVEAEPTLLRNLKQLSVLMCQNESVFPAISHLFKRCPNLSVLKIRIYDNETCEQISEQYPNVSLFDQDTEWKYQPSPLDKLLEASLTGFSGIEHEIEFVEFLLKNAVILKRLIVLFPTGEDSLNQSRKMQIIGRIMELQRTSPDVTIMFP